MFFVGCGRSARGEAIANRDSSEINAFAFRNYIICCQINKGLSILSLYRCCLGI